MIKVDVLIQEKRWKKYISNPSRYLKKEANKIKNLIPKVKNKKVSFSVLLTGNENIKKLNKQFRNKNKTTDVLSFPFYNPAQLKKTIRNKKNVYLGDVIINFYKIKNSSKKKNIKAQFNKLWIHGLLHLMGYRHTKIKDFHTMDKLENKILVKLKH